MSADPRKSCSAYFGVSPRLAPHLAFLLSDLNELGSDPGLVLAWLRERRVGPGSRVLDLGCGKGAVAIRLAVELGCRVDGFDFYAPFIEEARAGARRARVARRCHFEVKNLRDAIPARPEYDAVLFLSVGIALGGTAETVAALGPAVKPGGVMILDDGYSTSGNLDFHGYEDLRSREETLRALVSRGDKLVKETLIPAEEMRELNRRNQSWIEARAGELTRREPRLAGEIETYLRKQLEESRLLETRMQCATWMIERAPEAPKGPGARGQSKR